jgi:hypothetical protein
MPALNQKQENLMKSLLILSTLTLSALSFGQDIVLKPGSNVTITTNEPTTVSCAGAESVIPRCRIVTSSGSPASIYHIEEIGNGYTYVAMFLSYTEAVTRLKELKELEMCQ